ncbi:unnamed protein product, partial [Owenia fusiformis]
SAVRVEKFEIGTILRMQMFKGILVLLFGILLCTEIAQSHEEVKKEEENLSSEEEENPEANSIQGRKKPKSKEEAEAEHKTLYPEEYSDGVQGDMDLTPTELAELKNIAAQDRELNANFGKYRAVALNSAYCAHYCWKYYGTGIVYYYVPDDFRGRTAEEGNGTNTPLQVLRAAMDEIEEAACINFIEYKSGDTPRPYYVLVEYGTGCSAELGLRYKSGQKLSLGQYCTLKIGTAIHEVLHTLGFYHEHTREDRETSIDLHLENVDAAKLNNFEKVSDVYVDRSDDYDCGSVMHYSPISFSKDKLTPVKTITGKTSACEQKMGQRDGLSASDKIKLVQTYGARSCRPR